MYHIVVNLKHGLDNEMLLNFFCFKLAVPTARKTPDYFKWLKFVKCDKLAFKALLCTQWSNYKNVCKTWTCSWRNLVWNSNERHWPYRCGNSTFCCNNYVYISKHKQTFSKTFHVEYLLRFLYVLHVKVNVFVVYRWPYYHSAMNPDTVRFVCKFVLKHIFNLCWFHVLEATFGIWKQNILYN